MHLCVQKWFFFCVHYCVRVSSKITTNHRCLDSCLYFFSVGRKFREFRVCSRTLKYFSLTRGLLCVSWFTPPSHHQMAVASFFARRTMQFLTTPFRLKLFHQRNRYVTKILELLIFLLVIFD